MALRRLTCIALALMALAMPATAQAAAVAGTSSRLVIQSVETRGFPVMKMRLMVPSALLRKASLTADNFTVSENGEPLSNVRVRTVSATKRELAVVLVIDTSGSMKGRPLADAKRAAKRFVSLMGPRDRIAVVGFSSRPKVVTGYTSNRRQLDGAINSLTASGETAVYDALLTAARLPRPGRSAQESIILLSDGTDSVSANGVDIATKELRRRSTPVFAIALESSEFHPRTLALIARGTRGRLLSAKTSASLASFYTALARELQNQYELIFSSNRPTTTDIDIDVEGTAGSKSAKASTVLANPAFDEIEQGRRSVMPFKEGPPPSVALLLLTILLASGTAGMLTYGVGLLLTREPTALDQVSFYDQIKAGADSSRASDRNEEVARIKAAMMSAVGYVAGRRGITEAMHHKLEQADLPLRPLEYMFIHILIVAGLGMFAQLATGNAGLAILFILIGSVLPLVLLQIRIDRRQRAFRDQLPDILNLVAGSLRSGYGLLQAVGLVVKESMPPASTEFRRVETEAGLGLPVEEALEKMADRVGCDDFRWTVTAIGVQREVGGNLAEILDIVANTVRERDGLRRQIKALTGEGRISAMILVALPFIELGVLFLLNPDYMSRLFDNTVGVLMAIMALVLIGVGTLWLRKITAIEV